MQNRPKHINLEQQKRFLSIINGSASNQDVELLFEQSRRLTDEHHGRKIYVRGLLEITNVCRNNCYYCGIRRDSPLGKRFTLSPSHIEHCCRKAYEAGVRTFVLQGGENPAIRATDVAETVSMLSARFPEAAITLSLGEWPDEALQLFRQAGASRYLLRQEAASARLYGKIHPSAMSLENRIRCLRSLKRLGYQTGTGIMVGVPHQTTADILADLDFMVELQPEMIGIGPFVPAKGTPFEHFSPGSVELTLRLIAILRILFPKANIPATTALATLNPRRGHIAAFQAGANVVMPNISPAETRNLYALYNNKACSDREAIEQLDALRCEIEAGGFEMSLHRGDFKF